MKRVSFGLGVNYDGGAIPSVALNRHGLVVEVHRQQVGSGLFHTFGTLRQATVEWGNSTWYGNGNRPQVALNGQNVALLVNERANGTRLLDIRIGIPEGNNMRWIKQRHGYDHGRRPAIAFNDESIAVEVHQAWGKKDAWYHVWRVQGANLIRLDKGRYGWGDWPRVALNNRRDVVEVHYAVDELWCRVGRINDGNRLGFEPAVRFGRGVDPSVALTDEGVVIVTFEGVRDTPGGGLQRTGELHQRTGQLSGNRIEWSGDPVRYDEGDDSSVAAAGTMAVEVHEGRHSKTLWFSTSVIADRARWMQDRLATLGNKRLGDLVLPASHDAGMYYARSPIGSPWTKTQDLSIYEQLRYGIRYFDLRPKWTGSKFVIAHGKWNGPDLSEVLADIRKFGLENLRELAILKFSHFDNINEATYEKLVDKIQASIGTWLVLATPGKKRLADVTLNEYVENGPAFLVVVDRNYAIDRKRDGFWVYRDWNASPAEHDLRVFDVYARTEKYPEMRDHQFDKFKDYKGLMEQKPELPCDLFLLSWTLTPDTTPVRTLANTANRVLGKEIQFGVTGPLAIPNQYGKIMNLLYVDFVQSARVTDVALLHNLERGTQVASTRAAKAARLSIKAKSPAGAKAPVKAKSPGKAKSPAKAKSAAKGKSAAKAKSPAKAKPTAKAKGGAKSGTRLS